ncbi:hypothetical protein M427DRAFT_135457 [Gonapodya prolifera JEL478]|uniref:Transcription factor TFIIB cyclin-like domain-containing protein n=1 Tax=Gonapodya prolifera (strain JEL478) TaxID=1344416 RepID=A0A139AE21_GONPJ|nr:hypothetical protein M427DRAFT_135457 [Gonapodya prolifera JEL478]|eukprot:KXS15017.1 hypothetical protein M427DRAFT_135457 [Gonapodya prolifera JEL478]
METDGSNTEPIELGDSDMDDAPLPDVGEPAFSESSAPGAPHEAPGINEDFEDIQRLCTALGLSENVARASQEHYRVVRAKVPHLQKQLIPSLTACAVWVAGRREGAILMDDVVKSAKVSKGDLGRALKIMKRAFKDRTNDDSPNVFAENADSTFELILHRFSTKLHLQPGVVTLTATVIDYVRQQGLLDGRRRDFVVAACICAVETQLASPRSLGNSCLIKKVQGCGVNLPTLMGIYQVLYEQRQSLLSLLLNVITNGGAPNLTQTADLTSALVGDGARLETVVDLRRPPGGNYSTSSPHLRHRAFPQKVVPLESDGLGELVDVIIIRPD